MACVRAAGVALANARPDEGYDGKQIELRDGALAAYRRMVAAARAQEPVLAADRRMLTIFSGYRDPAADAARCAAEQNCDSIVRATCSAHRTGLAMDLFLAPACRAIAGLARPIRTDLYRSRSAAYLLAGRPRAATSSKLRQAYPFEPWHWEMDQASRRRRPQPALGVTTRILERAGDRRGEPLPPGVAAGWNYAVSRSIAPGRRIDHAPVRIADLGGDGLRRMATSCRPAAPRSSEGTPSRPQGMNASLRAGSYDLPRPARRRSPT